MDLLSLIATCAPLVAPDMMLTLVEAESGGHPYAIHDGTRLHQPRTAAEAEAQARRLLGQGRAIRVGLTQMTSTEWDDYGLTLAGALDPCQSLKAGERALLQGYIEEPGRIRARRLAAIPATAHAPADAPAAPATRSAQGWAFVPVTDGFSRAN